MQFLAKVFFTDRMKVAVGWTFCLPDSLSSACLAKAFYH